VNVPIQERISRYVACLAPAVAGQHGQDTAFRAACVLVHGFGLSEEQAWPFALEYNARCAPPWSQHELKHKLRSALTHPGHTRPRGYLLQDAGDELEHDIVPFDWADVFQQAEVDSIGERVALTPGPVRFRTPSSRRCTLGSGSGSSRCSSSAPTARGR
jgi:hypothetical protein